MICPNCFTMIEFSETICSKCGTPLLRRRADAIDLGHMGPRPTDTIPVETSRGGIWEPQGVSDEKLAKVHSPIGLELNAETPEEIAVSIMAEVMMIKDKGTGKSMKSSG